MKQLGLFAAAFGGTLAVLLVAFLVIEQLGAAGATAEASPSSTDVALASPTPAPIARPLPSQSAAPSASASASVAPSALAVQTKAPATAAPHPTATPRPTATPEPVAPGSTFDIVVPGQKYATSVVASNGTITKLPYGSILMSSERTISDSTEVSYRLPAGQVPPGTQIARLDVAVCGYGSGDFWETYGPADADPIEHEVTAPDADGCWHYLGGSGRDSTAHAIIQGATTLRISKVVYTITTR